MLRRCYDTKHPAFPYYGERGIQVCDRWRGKDGYANFLADMGEPPDGLTLERKENDKGYQPSNCRWATWKEQAANRRPRGPVANSLAQRARRARLTPMLVYLRIRRGWTQERALSTPILKRGGQPGHSSTRKPNPLRKRAKEAGLNANTAVARVYRTGMSEQDALTKPLFYNRM